MQRVPGADNPRYQSKEKPPGGLAAGTTPSSTLTIMKGLPVPVCMRPGQVERVRGLEPLTFSLGS